ncbi:MAG: MFS transporter [Clostridia bacterium]|nr:MFS transporter [Clostridia bacterium]
MNQSRSRFIRFCVLQGAWWSFYAAIPGFLVAYMSDRGLSESITGGILALGLLTTFLGALFWGRFNDRRGGGKLYYIVGNCAALALCAAMLPLAGNAAAMFVLYPLFGFMTGSVATTLDAWVISSMPERRDAVGFSRTFATLGYALVMLLEGQWISRHGYGIMLPVGAALIILSVCAALRQPETRRVSQRKVRERGGMGALLGIRNYRLLLLIVFITGLCVAPINNMKAVVIQSVGGDVSLLGVDAFLGCLIQALFMALSGKMRRLPVRLRLCVAVGMPLLYAVLVMLASSPIWVICGTFCNGISYGILFPTMREMTESSVSEDNRNTAHALVDTAYGSLSGMIATATGGALLQGGGTKLLGSVCTGLQLIAFALAGVQAKTAKE